MSAWRELKASEAALSKGKAVCVLSCRAVLDLHARVETSLYLSLPLRSPFSSLTFCLLHSLPPRSLGSAALPPHRPHVHWFVIHVAASGINPAYFGLPPDQGHVPSDSILTTARAGRMNSTLFNALQLLDTGPCVCPSVRNEQRCPFCSRIKFRTTLWRFVFLSETNECC